MIILDTNIISEIIKPRPNPKVIKWFDKQIPQQLAITTISIAELRYGIRILPIGKRRNQLDTAVTAILDKYFAKLILSFTHKSVEIYGTLASKLRSKGVSVSQSDIMIASITLAHDAKLTTRNVRDFKHCHIKVINPFL